MKESRVFELNQATAEQVLEAVTTFLRGEKSMEVQSVATPNGYLIQAAQADTLRTLSGMKLATTVELTVNGTQLNVTLGEGQWADKLGAGAVGLFLLWPLAVTAGIGAYKQKKLPSEIFEVVYRCTMGEPTSFRTAGVPVNAAPTAPAGAVCPQCGAQIFANARFCSACGAKLQTVCPGCGAPVKPGSKFCSECGQALSRFIYPKTAAWSLGFAPPFFMRMFCTVWSEAVEIFGEFLYDKGKERRG